MRLEAQQFVDLHPYFNFLSQSVLSRGEENNEAFIFFVEAGVQNIIYCFF